MKKKFETFLIKFIFVTLMYVYEYVERSFAGGFKNLIKYRKYFCCQNNYVEA